jgi:formate/nitrite transporter FocA (FNT family)
MSTYRREFECVRFARHTVWGNLAGSLFFGAIFIRYSGLASGPVETFITNTAATRGSLEWHQVFLRGIGCNIMVCLAVFVAQMSSDLVGKVFGIYFVLSAFGELLEVFRAERGTGKRMS